MDHVEILVPPSAQRKNHSLGSTSPVSARSSPPTPKPAIGEIAQTSPGISAEQSPTGVVKVSRELTRFFEELRELEVLPLDKCQICSENDFEGMLKWDVQSRVNFLQIFAADDRLRLAQYRSLLAILDRYSS
jgi:hypothetical protein